MPYEIGKGVISARFKRLQDVLGYLIYKSIMGKLASFFGKGGELNAQCLLDIRGHLNDKAFL